MKNERTWLGVGAAVAIFSTVAVGILSVAVLYFQFLRNFEENQTLTARKVISTSLDEFRQILEQESKRPFTEYSHSNFSGVSAQSFLRFSNISAIEPSVRIPGLVGFFQITGSKKLELPFFPEGLATDRKDRDQRRALARRIYGSIYKTQPINTDSGTRRRFQQIFQGVWLPNFDATQVVALKSIPTKKLSPKLLKSMSPIEKIEDLNPQSQTLSSNSQALPMQSFVLESGFLVFYRNVINGSRLLTQGFVVDQKTFFVSLFKELLKNSENSNEPSVRLTVLIEDQALGFFTAPSTDETLLFQTNELFPLEGITLLVSSPPARLSAFQAAGLTSVVLIVFIILIAIALMYRTTIRQIELSERQAAFVSAVSHELRTPITAIRMHGELLKSGWTNSEATKENSYDYILKESERLSRLIENVLRYARIGRDSDPLSFERFSLGELKALISEKIAPLVIQSGFILEIQDQTPLDASIYVEFDRDALTQILINIVDNGIKFSRLSGQKKIEITFKENGQFVEIGIRDFGPGILEQSRNQIFELFYRAQDELTQTTPGTGLGLALVKSLSDRMGLLIQVENRQPGLEFLLKLKRVVSE